MGMSPEALESFMVVMSSLKEIAVSLVNSDELIFSIQEGSALCSIQAPPHAMESVYEEVDAAIRGESRKKEIVDPLRKIQAQLQNDNYNYGFWYKKPGKSVEIHARLKGARKLQLKRVKQSPFSYQLLILRGFLNQIGGKNPNYHFDFEDGEKITVECSIEQAKSIKEYLYREVNSLVLCKKWERENKRDEFFHKVLLNEPVNEWFEGFLERYYTEEDLVKKLSVIHNFMDEAFANSDLGHEILRNLLLAFNDERFHLSELKTPLVISKPFMDHPLIKEPRQALLETYKSKRS